MTIYNYIKLYLIIYIRSFRFTVDMDKLSQPVNHKFNKYKFVTYTKIYQSSAFIRQIETLLRNQTSLVTKMLCIVNQLLWY